MNYIETVITGCTVMQYCNSAPTAVAKCNKWKKTWNLNTC